MNFDFKHRPSLLAKSHSDLFDEVSAREKRGLKWFICLYLLGAVMGLFLRYGLLAAILVGAWILAHHLGWL